ncbi:MAG: alanine racemase [Oligoflexia bacterium]|nr:alanine racemase [Oligoflexia bacterium]
MRFKTCLKINLNKLKENYRKLRELANSNKVLFVIKSNAYGHGIVPIVRFAVTELGIDSFGSASLGEAIILRTSLPDLQFDLYVFSDLEFENEYHNRHLINKRIIPVISTIRNLKLILESDLCKYIPLCLKFDTGMNRLGIKYAEIEELITLLKAHNKSSLFHVMSHFASSSSKITEDSGNGPYKQYQQFKEIKKILIQNGFTIERSSMANSGAIEQKFALEEETHIRPGLLLYGLSSLNKELRSSSNSNWSGENISSLETHVIDFYKIKKGDPIGYGGPLSPRDGTLVYLAYGYGDGLLNFYNKLKVEHCGFVGEIIGRISMDLMALLFPTEAHNHFNAGDTVLIWDHTPNKILSIADEHRVIPYEILCGISDRVPRVYTLS